MRAEEQRKPTADTDVVPLTEEQKALVSDLFVYLLPLARKKCRAAADELATDVAIQAAQTFDPSNGTPLEAWAAMILQRRITDRLRKLGRERKRRELGKGGLEPLPAAELSTDQRGKCVAKRRAYKPATDKPATDKPATDKPATDKPAADPIALDAAEIIEVLIRGAESPAFVADWLTLKLPVRELARRHGMKEPAVRELQAEIMTQGRAIITKLLSQVGPPAAEGDIRENPRDELQIGEQLSSNQVSVQPCDRAGFLCDRGV